MSKPSNLTDKQYSDKCDKINKSEIITTILVFSLSIIIAILFGIALCLGVD